MDNILNLKTYAKYLNLINEGLVLLPNIKLSNLIDDVNKTYRDKPLMVSSETHDAILKSN